MHNPGAHPSPHLRPVTNSPARRQHELLRPACWQKNLTSRAIRLPNLSMGRLPSQTWYLYLTSRGAVVSYTLLLSSRGGQTFGLFEGFFIKRGSDFSFFLYLFTNFGLFFWHGRRRRRRGRVIKRVSICWYLGIYFWPGLWGIKRYVWKWDVGL